MQEEWESIIRSLVQDERPSTDILPPIEVQCFGTANNKNTASVLLAFRSGSMASALHIPAKDIDRLCEALKDSALKALEA